MWVQVAVGVPAVDPRDRVADRELQPLPSVTGEDGTVDPEPATRQIQNSKYASYRMRVAFTPSSS